MNNKVNIVASLISNRRKDLVKTQKALSSLIAFVFLLVFAKSSMAVNVTVSITPLAGIVAPLLDENDQLNVMLKPGQSPHTFQLTPKDMKTLARTDLVVKLGTPVDVWLDKAYTPNKIEDLAMSSIAGLTLLPVREGGVWEGHGHEHSHEHIHEQNVHHEEGKHGSESHVEHDHDSHDQYNHAEHGHDGHKNEHENHDHENNGDGHESHEEHSQHKAFNYDAHLWLSPDNAVLMVKALSLKLQQLDPARANIFKQREADWIAKIKAADNQLKTQLSPFKNSPFIVLHDAFQYFEKHYQLNGVGSIHLNPMIAPSIKRVAKLRLKIKQSDVKCVFKEPQFPAKRVMSVVSRMDVALGDLDPIGNGQLASAKFTKVNVKNAQETLLYDDFIKSLGQQFINCMQAKP